MWPEGTRRDPARLQEDKRTWDPSLFRAEGQRSQREHPRDGASWWGLAGGGGGGSASGASLAGLLFLCLYFALACSL